MYDQKCLCNLPFNWLLAGILKLIDIPFGENVRHQY